MVDTLDHLARKGSEDSWEGRPSGHCSGIPYHPLHRIRHAPGCQRAGTRSGEVEGGHRQDKQGVDHQQPVWDQVHRGLPPGSPGRPGQQQHAHALQQPCAEPLPPSCGLSIPFGFP